MTTLIDQVSNLYSTGVYLIDDNGEAIEIGKTSLYDPPPPPTSECPTYEEVKNIVYAGLEGVYDLGDDYGSISAIKSTQPNIFSDSPFSLINIMSQCAIVSVDGPTDYDLQYLCSVENEMFYVPELLPSLLIHMGDLAPTALFTRNGFLTMTGGASLQEIQCCMTYCCHKILFILNKVYPYRTFKIDCFGIFNKVCTARLIGYKINLQMFVDKARELGYILQYDPDQINMVYLIPGPPFTKSTKASVAAKGGVVIMGFTKSYEARAFASLISDLLRCALRECDPESCKVISREHLKKNKKNKNIRKWQSVAISLNDDEETVKEKRENLDRLLETRQKKKIQKS